MNLLALGKKIAEAAQIAEMQLDELEYMSANDRADIAEENANFIIMIDVEFQELLGK